MDELAGPTARFAKRDLHRRPPGRAVQHGGGPTGPARLDVPAPTFLFPQPSIFYYRA